MDKVKERRTETHVYFLTGPGSQWYPCLFDQSLAPGEPEMRFVCREQYMMARKAHLFDDSASLDAIMRAVPCDPGRTWDGADLRDVFKAMPRLMAPVLRGRVSDPGATLRAFNAFPERIKKIGRAVKPYDDGKWSEARATAVYDGSIAAFSQDPHMRDWLLGTDGLELVEGSAKDRIWGVGLSWDDDAILDRANWRGENLLGKANMAARDWLARTGAFRDQG